VSETAVTIAESGEQSTSGHGAVPLQRGLSGHLFSWMVGGFVVGWFVLYCALRLGGDAPNTAALPAVMGGIVGAIAAVFVVAWVRRSIRDGRPLMQRARAVNPDALSSSDLTIVRLTWIVTFAAAIVTAAITAVIALHWMRLTGTRPKSTALMIVWDAVVALWLLDEGRRIYAKIFDGVEALYFGCLLTAVLASIGIARNVVVVGQIALIAAVGIAALTIGLVRWRLAGARFLPVSVLIAAAVAVLSVIIPLTA